MKKKVLSLLTVFILTAIMLVGCGGSDTDNSADKNTDKNVNVEASGDEENSSNTNDADAYVNDDDSQANNNTAEQDISEVSDILQYIINHEGKVPRNATEDDIEYENISELYVIVLEGIKNLDAEAMKPYVSEDYYNMCVEGFAKIKADATAADLWANTIGTMLYFPNAQVIVGTDVQGVAAMWYTDLAESNAELNVEDTDDLSVDELMNIYNTYYAVAPRIAVRIMTPGFSITDDGRIAISMDRIISGFYDESLKNILNPISYKHEDLPFDYYRVVMSHEQALALGYDYIKENFECYDELYAMDMDTFVTVTQGIDDKYKSGSFWKTFEKYYLDETNRVIMEKYLTESCLVYRELSNIVVYVPINFGVFPGNTIRGDEKTAFEALEGQIYVRERILKYPETFNNNFSSYATFADYAEAEGLFK